MTASSSPMTAARMVSIRRRASATGSSYKAGESNPGGVGIRSGAGRSVAARPIRNDLHPLEGDQPTRHHRVELGEDSPHALLDIHDLDQDREVLREPEDPRSVDVLLRPEALDPPKDRGAGQPTVAKEVDDCLVEWTALPRIRLTDVDAGQQACPLDLHASALPIVKPTNTVTSPSATDPNAFRAASPTAPSSQSRQLSSMSVENVVYAPRNPIISGPRMDAGRNPRSMASANSSPRTAEPDRLMTSVPHGNAPAARSATTPSIR